MTFVEDTESFGPGAFWQLGHEAKAKVVAWLDACNVDPASVVNLINQRGSWLAQCVSCPVRVVNGTVEYHYVSLQAPAFALGDSEVSA